MILQFKTFGTVSSIFLYLSQYLLKEKKQCHANGKKKKKSGKYAFISLKVQLKTGRRNFVFSPASI